MKSVITLRLKPDKYGKKREITALVYSWLHANILYKEIANQNQQCVCVCLSQGYKDNLTLKFL